MPDKHHVPEALREMFEDTQPPGLLDPDFDRPDFETVNLGSRDTAPSDSEITGDAALYNKSGSLYIKPKGGTETEIGKSSEAIEDIVNDVISGGSNIATSYNDSTNTLTVDVSPQGDGSGIDADSLDGNDTPLPASAINDGSGSGLDADTLDGKHASDLGGGVLQQDTQGNAYITTTVTTPTGTLVFSANDGDEFEYVQTTAPNMTSTANATTKKITHKRGPVSLSISGTFHGNSSFASGRLALYKNGSTVAQTDSQVGTTSDSLILNTSTPDTFGPDDTATFVWSNKNTGTMTSNIGRLYTPATKTTSTYISQTRSLVWLSGTQNTMPARQQYYLALNGSEVSEPWLVKSVTTGDKVTRTVRARMDNQTTSTFSGSLIYKGGTYI